MSLNATIGFSTTNLAISGAIRAITHSPVSHVWLAFDDASLGVKLVLQAETTSVQLLPWETWKGRNLLKAELSLDGPDPDEAIRWAVRAFVGAPYDWVNAGLSGTWRWFGRWPQTPAIPLLPS